MMRISILSSQTCSQCQNVGSGDFIKQCECLTSIGDEQELAIFLLLIHSIEYISNILRCQLFLILEFEKLHMKKSPENARCQLGVPGSVDEIVSMGLATFPYLITSMASNVNQHITVRIRVE